MPSALTCLARDGARTSLGGLRRLLGLSQTALASRLGLSQPHVAQLESQADMHLGTLRRHIAALGGELELVVRFPEQRIEITFPGCDPSRELPHSIRPAPHTPPFAHLP